MPEDLTIRPVNGSHVAKLFEETAHAHPDLPFISSRPDGGGEFVDQSYGDVLAQVEQLRSLYRVAGWGAGTRVALLIGNRPSFHVHHLALNGLGVSIVPLNPDARPNEMLYAIEHSEAALVVVAPGCKPALDAVLSIAGEPPAVIDAETPEPSIPTAPVRATQIEPGPDDEAAILYTSGTTGLPKGCILSNRYFVESATRYAGWDGLVSLLHGEERLLNPLPLFHMNNLVVSTTAMMLRAGCTVMIERFSPSSWWVDCRESRATLIHYLGVMPALLLARPVAPDECDHKIRAGIGAGVDPKHHAAFEARFGFPLLELWGMTEVGSGFIDAMEPRQVGTRAFGRPDARLEARIVDDRMQDLPRGVAGELLVRSGGDDPRLGFFSGYLKDEAATCSVWHEDWFRTGDVVTQDESGMLHFVDRKKNIVRRSGENIAAAEVEACLQSHPDVLQAAVIAMPDELREEEVFACVVMRDGIKASDVVARTLFDWTMERLVYFKAPGYVCFRKELPTTGTQKIQKGQIFAQGEDPLTLPQTHDLRNLKRRSSERSTQPNSTATA
ncbi:AMP-binding protein [Lutimaribacter marinistellae]|uniref:AMP-binding protein n=1 Tax=Lutimaribacter marinistellae TaxID=1820329 RepID=A0ABV7TBX4_9RHOB